MPGPDFWLITVMYSLWAYFQGHQASHCSMISIGQAELNPLFTMILAVYGWLLHPWLFLIWYGYKTVWWYAVLILPLGFALRLVWTKIAVVTGAQKRAWAISLVGIPIIPVVIFYLIQVTLWSTETSSLLEACRRCP